MDLFLDTSALIQKERKEYEKVKERAFKKISKGYDLGGKPLKREEINKR
jgi:hypothetical protein